jgi:effector-binding domain-containing protein
VVLFAAVGWFLPQTAHVERSIAVDAPPATVFTVLNGFRQFNRWSPWADIDPNATSSYEGPEAGVGARMSWSGNAEVGTGSQEILESAPYSKVKVRLVLGDFPGAFTASYLLSPEGSGTKVTWAFDGDYGGNVIGRYFGLLADSMLGPDYEKGLGRLKDFAESLPKADFSGLQFETTTSSAQPLVLMGVRSANDANAIGVAIGVAYGRLSGFISAQGLQQDGPPLAIYNGESGGALSIDAAIPVNRIDVAPAEPIRTGSSFAGRVVKAAYHGDYAGLPAAREQVSAYLATAGLTQDGPLWEQYVSDPANTPPAELVTNIFVPIK